MRPVSLAANAGAAHFDRSLPVFEIDREGASIVLEPTFATLELPLRWKIVVDVRHNLAIFLRRTYLRHILKSFEFCIPQPGQRFRQARNGFTKSNTTVTAFGSSATATGCG